MRSECTRPTALAALALIALVALSAPVRAADSDSDSDASGPDGRQAFLDLFVNDIPKQIVQVVLRGGDLFLQPADLEQSGLVNIGGARTRIGGQEFVSLRSLAPALAFQVDERELSLRLTVGPSLLPSNVVDLRPSARPEGLVVRRDPSGFLNYSAQLDSMGRLSAFGEAAASLRWALLYSGISRFPDGRVVRGLSNATVDEPERLRRWTVGDATTGSGVLGGAATLAGLTVQREYSLDPYFVRSPLPSTRGFASTPSTVEIYVNGILVRQQQIQPGSYELLNLPLHTGDSSYRTVVRDAFGRAQEMSGRYYFSSGVLAQGLTEYSYSLGLRRNAFGFSSFDYGGPGFLGRHRIGVTDAVTAGARLELASGLASGSGSVTTRLAFGEAELAAAVSGGSGSSGAAASASYLYASRLVSIGALLRAQSAFYATLSLSPQTDRQQLLANVFATAPLGQRVTINADAQLWRMRDTGDYRRVGVRGDVHLGRGAVLSLSAGHTDGLGSAGGLDLFATFTYAFEPLTSGSASVQRTGAGTNQGGVTVQRTLPQSPGFGYRVSAVSGPQGYTGENVVQYQSSFGRYEASYERVGTVNRATASAAGAVVLIDRALFFSRPVQESFALIQVPDIEGVRGYLNNLEIGRTDSRGNLLVPSLLPYYGNRLSIGVTDLPMDVDVEGVEKLIAAPTRGGAIVRFEARRVNAVTGELAIEAGGGETVPAYGELSVLAAGKRLVSPIGSRGEFYLEDVPPGTHAAEIEFGDSRCRFELRVPVVQGSRAELGRTSCVLQAAVAARGELGAGR